MGWKIQFDKNGRKVYLSMKDHCVSADGESWTAYEKAEHVLDALRKYKGATLKNFGITSGMLGTAQILEAFQPANAEDSAGADGSDPAFASMPDDKFIIGRQWYESMNGELPKPADTEPLFPYMKRIADIIGKDLEQFSRQMHKAVEYEDVVVIDILHKIELGDLDAVNSADYIRQIREARMKRRIAKDNYMLACALRADGNESSHILKALSEMKDRTYTPRVSGSADDAAMETPESNPEEEKRQPEDHDEMSGTDAADLSAMPKAAEAVTTEQPSADQCRIIRGANQAVSVPAAGIACRFVTVRSDSTHT